MIITAGDYVLSRFDESCRIEPLETMMAECNRPLDDPRPHTWRRPRLAVAEAVGRRGGADQETGSLHLKSTATRESSVASLCFFDFRQSQLAVYAFGAEIHLVAGFHCFQHIRIRCGKSHYHPFVHPELGNRSMLDDDLLRRLIDFHDLARNQ